MRHTSRRVTTGSRPAFPTWWVPGPPVLYSTQRPLKTGMSVVREFSHLCNLHLQRWRCLETLLEMEGMWTLERESWCSFTLYVGFGDPSFTFRAGNKILQLIDTLKGMGREQRPQSYTENYRSLRNAEWEKSSFPVMSAPVNQLIQYQMINTENIPAIKILQTE